MIKALKVSSWIGGTITAIVIIMFAIGWIYQIPEKSLYVQIFKPLLIIWITAVMIWAGIYFSGIFSGKFDSLF
jgi:predicted tellurium resistance membrane protein TerC